MAPLTFKFIAPGSELLDRLSDFYCGVPFMDNTLHSQCFVAEFPVDEQVFPYLVYEGDVLVAFFVLYPKYITYEYDGKYLHSDVIDISYLAVRNSLRYNGIGSAIMRFICDWADKNYPDILYIHVDALNLSDGSYTAVPFYKKNGFLEMTNSSIDTVPMLFALYDIDSSKI